MKIVKAFFEAITKQAWRMTLFGLLISTIITALILLLVLAGIESVWFFIAIALIFSGFMSFMVGEYIVSSRKLLEEQNHQLVAMNMELNAFAHTVAHDLKNPLSLMVSYADILIEDIENNYSDELLNHVHFIKHTGKKTTNIVDELLLLAQIRDQDIQLDIVDMHVVLQQVQHRLQKNINDYGAILDIEDNLPSALGYAPWIEEVWSNYITNALKYGGTPPQIKIGATINNDGTVCYWVKDNGDGISEDDQTKLFTEFTRLPSNRNNAEGTGLGLSIVNRIIRKLYGDVGVESSIGQGSKFYFKLQQQK